jgi:hypothetical protein
LSISAVPHGRAIVLAFTREGRRFFWSSRCSRVNMDLRLELRRTSKLVVASPKRGLGFLCIPFPALPCRAQDSSVPPGLVCAKGRDRCSRLFPGVVKHSFPRMNAGAHSCHFESASLSHSARFLVNQVRASLYRFLTSGSDEAECCTSRRWSGVRDQESGSVCTSGIA